MDIVSNFDLRGPLPPRTEAGYLDLDEGEGVGPKTVILSNGEVVNYNPPAPKPIIPDWSSIKSIRHYFNRTDPHRAYPAWFYHPSEPDKLIKNASEAKEIGVVWRRATNDEIARYGVRAVWDFADGCLWRPTPYDGRKKFDPANPGVGKTVIHAAPNPQIAQHELVREMVPVVAAAVAQAMKANNAGGAAPANVDPSDWAAFQEFLAWKKSAEVVTAVAEQVVAEVDPPVDEAADEPAGNALGNLSPEQEREIWKAEAERRGVKVDGRWGLERIKEEIEKAA